MAKIKPKRPSASKPRLPSRGSGCVVLMVIGFVTLLLVVYFIFKNLS